MGNAGLGCPDYIPETNNPLLGPRTEMLAFGAFLLSLGSVAFASDTVPVTPANDSIPAIVVPAISAAPVATLRGKTDSAQGRPKVIELSDWYYRRLTIHRWVAYGTLPVFAAQWAAGQRLYDDSRAAPTWAKTTHRVGATLLAGGFTVNTVTGVWNLWDSRSVPQGRALRTMHAISMLVADGLFTYAGAKLSDEAEQSADKRQLHRTIAFTGMGISVASGLAMKLWNK